MRVPVALGDFLVLRALAETGGFAVDVTDEEILAAQRTAAASEGLLMSPEGAAAMAGYFKASSLGLIQAHERVAVFNCATGLKYPMQSVDTEPVDVAVALARVSEL
jgi:threonine synthase